MRTAEDGGLPKSVTETTKPIRNDDCRIGFTEPELAAGDKALGKQGLNKFLEAHQRFNTPTALRQPDGSTKIDKNYTTKIVLKEIPSYADQGN